MEIATLISGPVLTPATAARLASRAATERVGLFPQAITPLLEDFVVRLGAIIGQLAPSLDLGLDLEELGRQAALDLADELSGLSLRALVADFHLQRAQQGRSFDTASSAAKADSDSLAPGVVTEISHSRGEDSACHVPTTPEVNASPVTSVARTS